MGLNMATTSSSSKLIRTSRRALSYDGELMAHKCSQVAPDTFGPDHASPLWLEKMRPSPPTCHPRPRSTQQNCRKLQKQAKSLSKRNHVRYHALARPTQSLGPVHATIVGCASVAVRKASWTVYHESASGNQTWSGQGFQTVSSGTFTLIDPAREKRHRRGLIPLLIALRKHFKKGVAPLSNQQGDSGGSG